MRRFQVNADHLHIAESEIFANVHRALKKHGAGAFISTHEISGTLREEYLEFDEAIRTNDLDKIKQEIIDVATVCVFALSSFYCDNGNLDIDRHPAKREAE